MIIGLHHVAIATPDLGRLAHFYCSLFGFRELYAGSWDSDARIDAMVALPDSAADYVVLGAGAARLELFQYRQPAGRAPDLARPVCDSGITHTCFQVTGIEAEVARLREAGMRFHNAPAELADGQLHRAVYGRDPDGNVIELIEIQVAGHPFGDKVAA